MRLFSNAEVIDFDANASLWIMQWVHIACDDLLQISACNPHSDPRQDINEVPSVQTVVPFSQFKLYSVINFAAFAEKKVDTSSCWPNSVPFIKNKQECFVFINFDTSYKKICAPLDRGWVSGLDASLQLIWEYFSLYSREQDVLSRSHIPVFVHYSLQMR